MIGSERAWMSWSSGKDSALALAMAQADATLDVVGLVTTVDGKTGEVPVHGVPLALVSAQAGALGLPLCVVELPWPCPNSIYEQRLGQALDEAVVQGVRRLVFGDLHLREIRQYRERLLAGSGIEPAFPLWGRDATEVADQIVGSGIRALLSCVDPARVPAELVGRWYDRQLLDELPPDTDPCGENGEFHTFVVDGEAFAEPVAVTVGATSLRDGFIVAELSGRSGTEQD